MRVVTVWPSGRVESTPLPIVEIRREVITLKDEHWEYVTLWGIPAPPSWPGRVALDRWADDGGA